MEGVGVGVGVAGEAVVSWMAVGVRAAVSVAWQVTAATGWTV